MNYKIVEDYIKSIEYNLFQDFCDRLLIKLYPKEFTPVRAGGRNGDMKNDGYCFVSRIFFQSHATRGESAQKTKNKIKNDFQGCIAKWINVKHFVYITNDVLIGEVEFFVDQLRQMNPQVKIETWSPLIIMEKMKDLDFSDIDDVLEGRLSSITGITKGSNKITTRYLVTTEFDFIKEITSRDLRNFPFDNTLLYETDVLRFTKNLLLRQKNRNSEVGIISKVSKDDYINKYPEAKVIIKNEKDDEGWEYFHERIPTIEELKIKLKADNLTQYLIENDISSDRISKILTCFTGECGEGGKFQELFLLRVLYAQYLLITNITNEPIRLTKLLLNTGHGVLYDQESITQE